MRSRVKSTVIGGAADGRGDVGGIEGEVESIAAVARARIRFFDRHHLAAEAAAHRHAVAASFDDEAVVIARRLERGEAAEEQRLGQIGAAVLRAQHAAIAALVAGVGEGGDLPRLGELHRADDVEAPAVRAARHPLDRRFARRDGQDEVGVVGAERDALVAGEAVEQHERAADLVGRRRVLRGAVIGVGDARSA